jgi:hypothetical protein
VIDVNDLQFRKADLLRTSTVRGITIDSSDEAQNACDSICLMREFGSNRTDESEEQYEKEDLPRISTPHGIKMDGSDEEQNA